MTSFVVQVEQTPEGFDIAVNDSTGEYAKVRASELWTGLSMLVPYMACVCEPDPFERFLGSLKRDLA